MAERDVEEVIASRIRLRAREGHFLRQMMISAEKDSAQNQGDFIDVLAGEIQVLSEIFRDNGLIRSLDYQPKAYWAGLQGRRYTFLDGGVASIDVPSTAPVGIRVGSYSVKVGERDLGLREEFRIPAALVTDLFSPDDIYENDFEDLDKLKDASRILLETSATLQTVNDPNLSDVTLLHGPLINPVSPYGLGDFPPLTEDACRKLLGDDTWAGEDEEREFVPLYLELLNGIEKSGQMVAGVVERSRGKRAFVVEYMIASLQERKVLKAAKAKQLRDTLMQFQLNDAAALDLILATGEYVDFVPVNRQGDEGKWPNEWKEWIREYPNAFTSYIKPNDLALPFRIETFESCKDPIGLVEVIYNTSRLLPKYGFPVGLDVVDKFAKVPAWLSRGVSNQHKVILLKKAIQSGDPKVIQHAKRILVAKGRDWMFRPKT